MSSPCRFGVFLVELDPTIGSEIQKTRPCVVVSPDDLNRALKTLIVAPMTSTRWNAPFRIPVRFRGRDGSITLDQIRAVDRTRLKRQLGEIDDDTARSITQALVSMFS